MAKRTLTYNGTNLTTAYGAYISGESTWEKAEPTLEFTSVPGRSGDLITFDNRYENVTIPYHMGIVKNFGINFPNLVAFLYKEPGYHKLVDSGHPGVYRMGAVASGISPEIYAKGTKAMFDVEFNCKPQVYLDEGDTAVEFTSSGTITNPTLFKSKPIVRVWGSGTVTVGGVSITIESNSSWIDIDSEIEDAYRNASNMNGYITLNSGSFPQLSPGSSSVTLGSGITRVRITPRWWRL